MPERHVIGDKETAKALRELPNALQKKILRFATRDAAKTIVLPDAKAKAPKDKGNLQRALAVRAATKLPRNTVGAIVRTRDGLFEGDEFYGGFQEFGWMMRNGEFNPGKPFLRPALYNNQGHVKQHIERWMTRLLDPVTLEIFRKTAKQQKAEGLKFSSRVLSVRFSKKL